LGLLPNDLSRETLKVFAGLKSEVVVEGAAGSFVCCDRFRLPTRPVKSKHELRDKSLAVQVRFYERPELGDELSVSAESEVGFDTGFESRKAELFEALDLGARRPVEWQSRERSPCPET